MTTGRRVAATVAVTVTSLLATSGCGAVDRAGSPAPATVVSLHAVNILDGEELEPFVQRVNRLSHGTIRLELRNNWHPGQPDNEADAVRAVRAGRVDVAFVPVRAWHDAGVTSFDAMIAPLTVDSYALERRVLADGQLLDGMLGGVTPLGLTGIGVLPGPMRKPVGVSHDLLAAKDFQAADIAISRSPVAAKFFDALGGTSTPSSFFGQPISAFDGAEQQVASVEGNRYDTVATSVTANVNLWPRPISVVANTATFTRLTSQQRNVLRRAARQSLDATLALQQQDEQDAFGILCRRGHIRLTGASADDIASLRSASRPVLDWLSQDADTATALARIESLRPKVATVSDETPSCEGDAPEPGPSAAAPGKRGPLDGTWTMTTSAAQSAASGGDDGGPQAPENFGDWLFIVDRGRFAFTQQNGAACTWGYGTWTVQGQRVEWRFTDGGGIAPSGAANKPGELFDFGWSLYRDTLTLTPVDGAVSPGNFLAQPWHRVSDKPEPRRFFTRCGLPAAATPN